MQCSFPGLRWISLWRSAHLTPSLRLTWTQKVKPGIIYKQLAADKKGGIMDATIKEIATLLRSTDEMAEQFIQRVQTRVGEPVSHAEILATMKKIPPKSLTMEKVVVKLKQKRKSTRRRAAQHQTTPQNRATAAPKAPANSRSAHARTPSSKAPKSVLDQLDSVLEGNWDRAEAEG
jgi:hypothetical protein